jgi:two-component system phosphate regulon sensor histidine kinase PhoR
MFEYLQGGQVVITSSDSKEEQVLSFFVKPNWSEDADALYSWRGMKRQNAKGAAIGSSYILASYPLKKSILSLWKDSRGFFISVIDSNLTMKCVTEVKGNWNPYFPISAQWLGKTGANEYGLFLNQTFFICRFYGLDSLTVIPVSSDVVTVTSLYDEKRKSKYKAVYLLYKEASGIINFLSNNNEEKFSARIPISDDVFLQKFKNRAAIISYSKSYPNSLLKIVDPERGVISETWIETSGEKIKVDFSGGTGKIFFLESDNQQYYLNIFDYSKKNNGNNNPRIEIPSELIEPMGLWLLDGILIALFRNGIATFDCTGKVLAIDFFPFGEYFTNHKKLSIDRIKDYLVLASPTSSVILKRQEHDLWYINRFFANFGRILLPTILILIIIILFIFFRRQKALLEAVLNLPATGVVFIIDKYGRLKRANGSGKKLLGITDSIPMRRMFRYYCEMEHTKPITELVEKAIATRDTFTQKLNIVKANDMFEWVFNVIALRNATGIYKGFVLTGIDITEQLERKRLSNWAQLAHDMQTNLSTIRLNAEQFDIEEGTNNANRRKKIIHQVGLLIQRVRDVVTVGRSDTINKELVDAYDICHEVRSEFDEAVFPNVSFAVDVQHFNIFCDKPKMIRAVRNAVENGIKSMQGKPGSIVITNWNDAKYAYIGVQDTGPGMDDKTMKKMLTPYFTTAKKSGGAGIGTMIMQHVMELHGGEIQVKSELGVGTQIVFCIPNYAHNKTSKAIADKVSSLRPEKN